MRSHTVWALVRVKCSSRQVLPPMIGVAPIYAICFAGYAPRPTPYPTPNISTAFLYRFDPIPHALARCSSCPRSVALKLKPNNLTRFSPGSYNFGKDIQRSRKDQVKQKATGWQRQMELHLPTLCYSASHFLTFYFLCFFPLQPDSELGYFQIFNAGCLSGAFLNFAEINYYFKPHPPHVHAFL